MDFWEVQSVRMIIGAYEIDVDVEATRAYYAGYTAAEWNCDCAGCRNFARAAEQLPEMLREYLAKLGLEADKPVHITPEVAQEGGTKLFYTGWYHLRGTLPHEVQTVPLPDCDACLTTDCTVLSREVLSPLLQLDFSATLPWVLEEPNTYEL